MHPTMPGNETEEVAKAGCPAEFCVSDYSRDEGILGCYAFCDVA